MKIKKSQYIQIKTEEQYFWISNTTLVQSIKFVCWRFWFWRRKSTTGPGFTSNVVDTSVIKEQKKYQSLLKGNINFKAFSLKNLPTLRDKPFCVTLKLEWKPRQHWTPPSILVIFLGLSWKYDWRIRRHPLEEKEV
jgi:hypothetical protein